jgi:hypothetical protein
MVHFRDAGGTVCGSRRLEGRQICAP